MKKLIPVVALAAAVIGFSSLASAEAWSPAGPVALTNEVGKIIVLNSSLSLECDVSASGALNDDSATINSMTFSSGTLGLCSQIKLEGLPYNVEPSSETSVTLQDVTLIGIVGMCFGDLSGDFDQATGQITFTDATIPSLPTGDSPCVINGVMQTTPQASYTFP